MTYDVHIIGGGLAGSEAAWQLARRGFKVRLSEMRGSGDTTPAHQTDGLAELVCSNSFRSDDDERNAVGLLHHEMRRLDSLIMLAGEKVRVPAGSAMARPRMTLACSGESPGGRPPTTIGARCGGRPLEVSASAPTADRPPAMRDAWISRPRPVRSRSTSTAATATAPLTPAYTDESGSGV